jgi:Zn-dependent protease
VKNLAVFLALIGFAASAAAQTPAQEPVQIAQAGGAAQGASLPPASGGTTSAVIAVVAVGVAAVASVVSYNSTSSNH